MPFVVRRRAAFTAAAITLGAMYALLGPVPPAARACVLLFDMAVIPYAFALDWVAWGLGHFGMLSIWRSGVSILYVAMAIVAMHLTARPIASISGSNIFSATASARRSYGGCGDSVGSPARFQQRIRSALLPKSSGHLALLPSECRIC